MIWLLTISLLLAQNVVVVRRAAAAGACSPTDTTNCTYHEQYNGTGYENNQGTWTESGGPNEDCTAVDTATCPLEGTHSWYAPSDGSAESMVNTGWTWADDSEEWCMFQVEWDTTNTGSNDIFMLRDSGPTNLANVEVTDASPCAGVCVKCEVGAAAEESGLITISANGTNWIKLRYKDGTGSNAECEIWAAQPGDGSWESSQSYTTGSSNGAVADIAIRMSSGADDSIVDNVICDDADLAWPGG
jgi:hypothetical protein